MNKVKSIWLTITGSISSIIPLFFAVCKSGACTAVCVSPIASLLGISSASMVASPLTKSLFPILLAISAVSFTVSYYKLYVLPKYATASKCTTDCACEATKESKQYKFSLYTFWIGLIASVIFFTYFEFQNYQANSQKPIASTTEKACCTNNDTSDTAMSKFQQTNIDSTNEEKPCCAEGESCE